MNAYLFDVDGVLNNLEGIVNKELVAKLSQILLRGDPLALISGRGYEWQLEHVVTPIEKYIAEKNVNAKHAVDNLIVSGEFGGVNVIHKNSERQTKIDSSVAIPEELRVKLTEVTSIYTELLYVQTEKMTMFTSAINNSAKIKILQERKSEIIDSYNLVMRDYPNFNLIHDRFSINIKHKNATKKHATAEVIEWLELKHIKPAHFYAFGDSIPDLEIGEELFKRKLPLMFIYVGLKEEIDGYTIKFPYTVTNADFDLGTLEYFNSN